MFYNIKIGGLRAERAKKKRPQSDRRKKNLKGGCDI